MLNFIKNRIGTWISVVAVLLSLVALIIYGVAIGAGGGLEIASASQPFYEFTRPEDAVMKTAVVTCGVLALVLLVITIALGQFKFNGLVGKICDIAVDVLRVAVPVLLFLALIYFIYGSFTGLGWTFFSNEELEIYPEAIKVGNTVIAGSVILAVAGVVSIVAPFFDIAKKDAE